MAFNLSKFNQTYFNRLNLSSISLTVEFTEDISAECGIAAEFRSTAAIVEKVTASANGQSGILPVVSYEEEISGSAVLGITALPVCRISEAVSASGKAAAQYGPPAAFTEIVSSDVEAASMLSVNAAISENVTAKAVPGALLSAIASYFELVNGSASVETTEVIACLIDVTLQPGDRLVVDAVTYNVYLNDENIVDLHRGEWIDELNRDTINLEVIASTGTNNLEAQVLYTERYL